MAYENIVAPSSPDQFTNIFNFPFNILAFFLQPWVYMTLAALGIFLLFIWFVMKKLNYADRFAP